jgi:site-specific DNA-methyltransferase (adenine-specific)
MIIDTCELYNEDCLIKMNDIPDKSVDMILCDLPYGTTQCKWDVIIPFESLWKQYNRIIKDNGAVVLFGSEPFSSYLRISNIKYYKYDWIWDKIKGTGFLNAKKQPMRNNELISVFYRNQCIYKPIMTTGHNRKTSYKKACFQTDVYGTMKRNYRYDSTERYPRSIIECSTDTQNCSFHPTQKPVALMEYLIKTYTNEGETVIDNCMGSGTTGVACINTGRKFIGMEWNPEENKHDIYFNIAVERIKQAVKYKKEEQIELF